MLGLRMRTRLAAASKTPLRAPLRHRAKVSSVKAYMEDRKPETVNKGIDAHKEKEVQGEFPGIETKMDTQPIHIRDTYKGSDKLKGKVAIITGGDSGIGHAVAVHFAREGADVAIMYLPAEQKDAERVKSEVEKEGRRCILIPGDVGDHQFCKQAVDKVVSELGHLDILVNNASEQHYQESLMDITPEQLERTFRTNVFGYFYMSQAALPHLKEGSSIVNTSSVNAFKGHAMLLDYSATKGAETAFTRSLAQQLATKNIRVNSVAPGPIYTPFVTQDFPEEKLGKFVEGSAALGRPGQPAEVATAYVFLASEDSSYYTGQTLHPNGGAVVNA